MKNLALQVSALLPGVSAALAVYGEKVGDQMSAWLNANGPAIEKALMSWSDVPVPAPASRKVSNPTPFNG